MYHTHLPASSNIIGSQIDIYRQRAYIIIILIFTYLPHFGFLMEVWIQFDLVLENIALSCEVGRFVLSKWAHANEIQQGDCYLVMCFSLAQYVTVTCVIRQNIIIHFFFSRTDRTYILSPPINQPTLDLYVTCIDNLIGSYLYVSSQFKSEGKIHITFLKYPLQC